VITEGEVDIYVFKKKTIIESDVLGKGPAGSCGPPEGGHMGPPLQQINYLYNRSLESAH